MEDSQEIPTTILHNLCFLLHVMDFTEAEQAPFSSQHSQRVVHP